MLDEAHLAGGDRPYAAVEFIEMKALQVREITWDMKREDLAFALPCELEGRREAVKDREATGRPIPLPDDVLVGAQLMDLDGQPLNRLSFAGRQREHAIELADNRLKVIGAVEDMARSSVLAGAQGSLRRRLPRFGADDRCTISPM